MPKKLTGIDKLVQIVALSFLRNPGKSVLAPNEGSGLRAEIGQFNFSSGDGTEIKSLAVQRTRAVEQEVIGRQSPTTGTPEDRLSKITVLDFAYDSSSSSAALRVKIYNEAGNSADVIV